MSLQKNFIIVSIMKVICIAFSGNRNLLGFTVCHDNAINLILNHKVQYELQADNIGLIKYLTISITKVYLQSHVSKLFNYI